MTRLSDETILEWIHLRRAGYSTQQIGIQHGVTGERVRTATNRVKSADADESGENTEGAYW